MKNQSVLTVNALAAVLVSAGLLSACAGESAGEPVGYTNQRPERSDVEQRPSGSDYDRPLPNPQQPLPPEEAGDNFDNGDDDFDDDDFDDDDRFGEGDPGDNGAPVTEPPSSGNTGGRCNNVCSGAGACTSQCLELCQGLPPGCESVAGQIASCIGEMGGDCDAAFLSCAFEHTLEVAACAGGV